MAGAGRRGSDTVTSMERSDSKMMSKRALCPRHRLSTKVDKHNPMHKIKSHLAFIRRDNEAAAMEMEGQGDITKVLKKFLRNFKV